MNWSIGNIWNYQISTAWALWQVNTKMVSRKNAKHGFIYFAHNSLVGFHSLVIQMQIYFNLFLRPSIHFNAFPLAHYSLEIGWAPDPCSYTSANSQCTEQCHLSSLSLIFMAFVTGSGHQLFDNCKYQSHIKVYLNIQT